MNVKSEWSNILITLCDGVPILTPTEFICNNIPPPIRNKYLMVRSTVNKLVYAQYVLKNVIIIPTTFAVKLPGIHFSNLHWTAQFGKESGRMLADPSNGDNPLNSKNARLLVDDTFGVISHPTIQQLIQMILLAIDEHGIMNIMLWKKDLRGAFTLLNILPRDVQKCAYELTDGLTMIHLTGFFGWMGFPAAFHVITKVLVSNINPLIDGKVDMYVDDVMGVSPTTSIQKDMTVANKIIQRLVGEDAVNDKKDEHGRKSDWIGWCICLDRMSITVAHKNLLKCLHGMFSINLENKIQVKYIMKLASWTSRYSLIYPCLKPLCNNLYAETVGMRNLEAFKFLGNPAIFAIWMWRAILCLIALRPDKFSRELDSFRILSPTIRIEYDASLTGLGLKISRINNGSWAIWKVAGVELPYLLDSSGYQNTVEFLAVVLGIAILTKFNVTNEGIILMGDNVSSLSWSEHGSFVSGYSQCAAVLFCQILITSKNRISHTVHVKGVDNIEPDQLSRGVKPLLLGYNPEQILDPSDHPFMNRCLDLGSPLKSIYENNQQFTIFWNDVNSYVNDLISVRNLI